MCGIAAVKKNGTIQSLNVSPKGFYEGFLLKTGNASIQINLPKDHHGFGEGRGPDTEVAAEVEPEEPRGTPEHSVFRMVRVLGTNRGQQEGSREFSRRIERLNYALHGKVNGGILDSGDFMHLKPEGARAVGLKTGMIVEGKGKTKPMVGGRSVIEAEQVNGIATGRHRAKKKHSR
jgi:hypothetical protein